MPAITSIRSLALGGLLVSLALPALAQSPQSAGAAGPAGATDGKSTVKVVVVLSKFQGDKKVSSLPYTLIVQDGTRGQLRMNSRVRVPSLTPVALPVVQPPDMYQDIGTNIDISANNIGDGRYRLLVSIGDTSLYETLDAPTAVGKPANVPMFHSFTSVNTSVLRDGQTIQFVAATDKFNGEVIKADVTLNVLK